MQEATAEASAVQPPQASEETVVDRPAIGGHSTSQLGEASHLQILLHACNIGTGLAQCLV